MKLNELGGLLLFPLFWELKDGIFIIVTTENVKHVLSQVVSDRLGGMGGGLRLREYKIITEVYQADSDWCNPASG